MNRLKDRGEEEILITRLDSLTGFPQTIKAVYPGKEVRLCIIYQIRNHTKNISCRDLKSHGLSEKVYAIPDEQTAFCREEFGEKREANIRRYVSYGTNACRLFPPVSSIPIQ